MNETYQGKPWYLTCVETTPLIDWGFYEIRNRPSDVIEVVLEASTKMAKNIENLLCLQHWMKDMKPAVASDKFIAIRTPDQLRLAIRAEIANGNEDGLYCFLQLVGGGRSSMQIWIRHDDDDPDNNGKFEIFNGIDGSEQILDDVGLFMESNIGKFMVEGHFWMNRPLMCAHCGEHPADCMGKLCTKCDHVAGDLAR